MTAEITQPSDGDLVKVTTRLKNGRAQAMRIAAAQQGITIETAYREAVTAYLGFSKKP